MEPAAAHPQGRTMSGAVNDPANDGAAGGEEPRRRSRPWGLLLVPPVMLTIAGGWDDLPEIAGSVVFVILGLLAFLFVLMLAGKRR